MASGPVVYEFNAEDASGKWVNLEIIEADELCIRYFEKVWHKLTQAVSNACALCNEPKPAPSWTGWKPHEWNKKAVANRLKFAAWDGDILAGFLNLRTEFKSVADDKPLIYVEHVATFPGNMPTDIWHRRLKKVGVALMAFAAYQANQRGCQRIGLHADEEAVGWYDQIHEQFNKLFEVRQQGGIQGPHPNSTGQIYFETSIQGTARLLENYKNG